MSQLFSSLNQATKIAFTASKKVLFDAIKRHIKGLEFVDFDIKHPLNYSFESYQLVVIDISEDESFEKIIAFKENNKQTKIIIIVRKINSYLLGLCVDHSISGCVDISNYSNGKEIADAIKDSIIFGYRLNLNDLNAIRIKHKAEDNNNIPSINASGDRKQDVLQCLANGLTTKQMSVTLGISTNTINDHKKALFKKLRVNSAIEAINKGRENGLIK